MIRLNLGSVTAYSIAVKNGFTGTEAEWMQAILNAGENAQDAAESAQSAAESAQDALDSATASANSASSAEESVLEAKIRYGSPLVAHLVADMEDENRVYVYVGEETGYTTGNWYYYDGTTWTSGGVYNGEGVNTDSSLLIEDMPADAKAVGDAIDGVIDDVSADLDELKSVDEITDFSSVTLLYPTESAIKTFSNPGDISSVYIPIISGATYTISKTPLTSRFALGTTQNIPVYNEPVINYLRQDSATSLTIKATGNSNYLLIWFRRSADSAITEADALASLLVTQTIGAKDVIARTDIEGLASDITTISSWLYSEKKYIDYSSDAISGGYSTTKRWFCGTPIPAGLKVTDILYQTNGNSGNGYIELWAKNGNTLTKYKSIPFSSSSASVKTANVGVTTPGETYISFLTTFIQLVGYKTGGSVDSLYSSDVTEGTTTLSFSDLVTMSGYTPLITVKYQSPNIMINNNVVYIGDGGQFDEVQDALTAITDDSITNPYTFMLLPRGTAYNPFTMIRDSFSDTYPWTNSEPRYISIIGMDKAHCVIQSDSGDYNYPCAEILTNGIIKNLTFVMTNEEQTATAVRGGYCIHIDSQTKNNVGYDLTIEDCDFYNASNACLGLGIHENCDLKIRRCHMNTTLQANYSPHEGYENKVNNGCVFAHTSTLANSQNQRLTLEDCIGSCAEGNKSIQISSAGAYDPSTADFMYTLIRNVFWNKALARSGYSISSNLPANPMNFGNNNS